MCGAGSRQLVMAACTFGNSMTLPLVFLFSLLPSAAANKATGYIALFMMGWSPMLWTLGMRMLQQDPPGMQPVPAQGETQVKPASFKDRAADVLVPQTILLHKATWHPTIINIVGQPPHCWVGGC